MDLQNILDTTDPTTRSFVREALTIPQLAIFLDIVNREIEIDILHLKPTTDNLQLKLTDLHAKKDLISELLELIKFEKLNKGE